MKCMVLWGEPGTMIDACIHLPLMSDPSHAIIITVAISTIYIQFSVYKQQCSYMNRSMASHKFVPVCHESWDIAKQ